MAELEYGFRSAPGGPLIKLEANNELLQRIDERHPEFSSDRLLVANRTKTVVIEETNTGTTFIFDFKRSWRARDKVPKEGALQSAKDVLVTLVNSVMNDENSPLYAQIGSERFAEGRLQMYAAIRWPETDDDTVTELATTYMRSVADDLRYATDMRPSLRRESVYGVVNRDQGVILQTNPAGSCSLDTDGSRYDPIEEFMEVYAHNIYSREQQIICLAGAIAIAKADELEKL